MDRGHLQIPPVFYRTLSPPVPSGANAQKKARAHTHKYATKITDIAVPKIHCDRACKKWNPQYFKSQMFIKTYLNKSNGVRTTDAFSLVLIPLYHTFTCIFVLLILTSSSNSHDTCFRPLSNSKTALLHDFNSCVTDGPTDGPTDGQTDRRTNRPSYTLIL